MVSVISTLSKLLSSIRAWVLMKFCASSDVSISMLKVAPFCLNSAFIIPLNSAANFSELSKERVILPSGDALGTGAVLPSGDAVGTGGVLPSGDAVGTGGVLPSGEALGTGGVANILAYRLCSPR